MGQCAEEIENELHLLGATAIEDRLQDKVPECISLLREAGLKVWVLTGDKLETAINIGFASNLLLKSMTLIVIKADDSDEAHQQIKDALNDFGVSEHSSNSGELGLIIDGHSLRYVMEFKSSRNSFLKLATSCKSVICCRVSPKQKAQVVKLVKKGLNVMCLSIGDGANDVSMIQEAHVGIGISGQEGLQAAMSSDFVIAQFHYLSKLLLVHGHWSYVRLSKMILNFFFKNFVWVFSMFFYQLYCGFTADILFDYTFLMFYNLLFVFLPTAIMGVLDQDFDATTLRRFPKLYGVGPRQEVYTFKKFWQFFFEGICMAAICFFGGYFVFHGNDASNSGYTLEKQFMGTTIALYIIVTVNLCVTFRMSNWTWITVLALYASIASFVLYVPIWSRFRNSTIFRLDTKLYSQAWLWLGLLVVLLLNFVPRVIMSYLTSTLYPSDEDIVREIKHIEGEIREKKVSEVLPSINGLNDTQKVDLCATAVSDELSIHQEENGHSPLVDQTGRYDDFRNLYSIDFSDKSVNQKIQRHSANVIHMATHRIYRNHGFAFAFDDDLNENLEWDPKEDFGDSDFAQLDNMETDSGISGRISRANIRRYHSYNFPVQSNQDPIIIPTHPNILDRYLSSNESDDVLLRTKNLSLDRRRSVG